MNDTSDNGDSTARQGNTDDPLHSSQTNNLPGLLKIVWVLWHINHCGLFNAKSSLYIYIYIPNI